MRGTAREERWLSAVAAVLLGCWPLEMYCYVLLLFAKAARSAGVELCELSERLALTMVDAAAKAVPRGTARSIRGKHGT